MAEIILVTGGTRSGKSAYAQRCAEEYTGEKLYIATCPRIDAEMDDRIAKHIADRAGRDWHTIEEQVQLVQIIKEHPQKDVILIDCLTLWVNNLLFDQERLGSELNEDHLIDLCSNLVEVSLNHSGKIFFVTNEIGSGIVPENPTARRYRDLVGRCNQFMAAKAAKVILVCCGIPLTIKGDQ